MSTALTKHEPRLPALQMDETELMQVLQSSLYPGASPASIKMVLGYCKASGLDPMQKPVHIVPMWDGKAKQMRDVVMPGIGLYRTQAARTGEHVGTDEPVFGPMVEFDLSGFKITVPEWCKVTVYRLVEGQKCAYTAIEYWTENYATSGKDSTAPNAMWKKRSRGQIAKCAEAQALRKGFPEVGNQPTAEEMEGKALNEYDVDVSTGEITPQKQAARQEPVTWPDDKFAAQVPRWSKAVAEGIKTADEILTMARSKGALTAEQEKTIKAFRRTPADGVTDAAIKNETTAEPSMSAAEQEAHAEFLAGLGD